MIPTVITWQLCAVSFCMLFFGALGWFAGAWVVARTLGRIPG